MPISKVVELAESLCVGCGLCVKKCPFGALKIINLPKNLTRDCTHRYGLNAFKLHRYLIKFVVISNCKNIDCLIHVQVKFSDWSEPME